jgi:hypothetical protein
MEEHVEEARAAARRWMDAVNAVDDEGLLANAHVPHVRIQGTNVIVFETAEDLARRTLHVTQRNTEPWARTDFDRLDPVHATAEKVHFAVTFSRFDHEGRRYASYDSLWIVARKDGRWGVLARSSFAP